ncbi:M48 family metallopeptidase [Croceicoccus sp. F390]|uniref:M48 family metallopeptidase n=1 Tax=Croceicoccus esteveae TaxID=3075597 RepID=A0ABU2ZK53_9SPHN|nr:M48 family metallopeptidase [Croceicoccus sp. F390]MDT0576982.1 M48 family metallopeptidase [Croceicoccus sp. F390]
MTPALRPKQYLSKQYRQHHRDYWRKLGLALAILAPMLLMVPLLVAPASASPILTTPDIATNREQQALQGIAMLDQRIATLAYRLATGSSASCSTRTFLPGFAIHHLSQYRGKYRAAAQQLFGLAADPVVLSVAADSSAQRAGLRSGDRVLAVDGQSLLPFASDSQSEAIGSAELVEEMEGRLDTAFADGEVSMTIARGDAVLTIPVMAQAGCSSRVYLNPSAKLNAYADGSNIIVTTAISTIVRDDSELAAVLAHELAHNILGHPARLDAIGRSGKQVRQTEIEADRLSVHLLYRAGFDPAAAVRLWSHVGPRNRKLFPSHDHPDWRRRIAIITDEIARLAQQPGGAVP